MTGDVPTRVGGFCLRRVPANNPPAWAGVITIYGVNYQLRAEVELINDAPALVGSVLWQPVQADMP